MSAGNNQYDLDGFMGLHYYGVLEPELSNFNILTSDIGVKPWDSYSLVQ